MMRSVRSLTAAISLLLIQLASGCGGSDRGTAFDISIEPESGAAGTRIAYTLTGCKSGPATVDVYDDDAAIAESRAPKVVATGKGTRTGGKIVMPLGSAMGLYSILATCPAQIDVASSAFTVTD